MVSELNFICPPECGGQIVEVLYALTDDGHVIRMHIDRSDGERWAYISRALADDEGDYWNGGPKNKRWRRMRPAERKSYELGF